VYTPKLCLGLIDIYFIYWYIFYMLMNINQVMLLINTNQMYTDFVCN